MFRTLGLCAAILFCMVLRPPVHAAPNPTQLPPDFELVIPFASTIAPTSWIPIDVKVNGKGPYPFLLDTGFGTNCVTPSLAAELGIKPYKTIKIDSASKKTVPADFAALDTLQFGNEMTLRHPGCIITSLPEGMPFRGVLGKDVFANFVVTVDYQNKTITLHNPATFHYQGKGFVLPIEIDTETGFSILPGTFDGIAGRFVIDTGNISGLTLYGHYVATQHLKKRYASSLISTLTETVTGTSKTISTTEPTLALGTSILRHVPTELQEPKDAGQQKEDGNIGGSVLQRFTITFDYPHKTVCLEPNANFDVPYPRDRSGLDIHYEKGIFGVRIVYKDSPASAAGLRKGDQITKIDGKDAAQLDLLQWSFLVCQPEGTVVHFTVKRGTQTHDVTLTLKDYK